MSTALYLDGHRLDAGLPPKMDYPGVDYMPDVPTPLVSDEWLELWGNVFQANNLYAKGIEFMLFVMRPREILDELDRCSRARFTGTDDVEPPLPAQARVQRREDLRQPISLLERIEADLDRRPGTVNRNGTWIERLRHHAWPRHTERRIS